MTTSDLIALGGVLVGFGSIIEVRYFNHKKELERKFENFERIIDLKISEAVAKLKDERLHELLRENEFLTLKNEKLKDSLKDFK